jgi:hypothetical protein
MTTFGGSPLLALWAFVGDMHLAAVDWGEVIVPIVVFVVWVINQLAGGKKPGNVQPPRRPPVVPPGGGKPVQPNAPARGGLMDEVEQFLRQAKQAMEDAQKPKPRPQKPQPVATSQRPAPPKQKQQKGGGKQNPRKNESQPQRKSLAEQSRLQPSTGERSLGGGVAAHVQQHLDTSRFDERAGKLSHLKQTVEQDIGGHVHGALDHQLGRYAAQAETTADDGSSTAAMSELIAMLREPQSLRNAIILQEILTPPTARWK